jgi:Fe-S cluster assembly protein SufD
MATVFEQIAESSPVIAPEFLQPLREKTRAALATAVWPDRKTEGWKYTSLRSLEQGKFFSSRLNPSIVPDLTNEQQRFAIPALDGHRLVFVNGVFNEVLSSVQTLPLGVTLARFSTATQDQQTQINQYLNHSADVDKHLFTAVNNRLLTDGVFLHIAKHVELDQPVHIVWLSTSGAQPFHIAQRFLAVLEDNAKAVVVEHFTSTDAIQNNFTHGVTELFLAAGAQCDHYRLQMEESHALHIGGVHASLGRNAQLNSFHLAFGSTLKRLDIVINHDGEGAHCDLNGVYLPRQDQHVDYHTCIEHRVPHCTTKENFRGIVADNGRAVFNGRIHIHRNAQKTSAQLSNKNLLTSNKAEVDTKPELEIYADDVQCAHGATVAQLDEAALHYFRTRGIAQKEAEVMLSFGFINELINEIQHPVIADYLRPILAGLFARDPDMLEQL